MDTPFIITSIWTPKFREAHMTRARPEPASRAAAADRSIDDLDEAIRRSARQINAETYQFHHARSRVRRPLRLDEVELAAAAPSGSRGVAVCRCPLRASTCARRTRCAGCPRSRRHSPRGGLSYSKVRALTRAAHLRDEDSLLAYALRCHGGAGRGALPADSQRVPRIRARARRAWERRSLSVWRNRGRAAR